MIKEINCLTALKIKACFLYSVQDCFMYRVTGDVKTFYQQDCRQGSTAVFCLLSGPKMGFSPYGATHCTDKI